MRNDIYLNVISSSIYISQGWGFQDPIQYYLPEDNTPSININVNISPSTDEIINLDKSPLGFNFGAVITDETAFRKSLRTENIVTVEGGDTTTISHGATEFGDTVEISASYEDVGNIRNYYYKKYLEKHFF